MRAALLRVLAVLALLVAAPGSADLVRDALELAAGAECCEADCEGSSKDCCAASCGHCSCCARPTAVAGAGIAWPGLAVSVASSFSSALPGASLPGYRDPPIRPPTAA